jgi:arsenate reductase
MVEALWQSIGQGEWRADSAGSRPAGYVHPLAIRAMRELGIDISTRSSKSLDQFRDESFDLVVTVCDNAQGACPAFPGAGETLHWPFDDPADATGTEEEQLVEFRRVRDEIREKIKRFLHAESTRP